MKKLSIILKVLICVSAASYCGTAQAQEVYKKGTYEIQFQTLSFEDFGGSGFYGIGGSFTSIGDRFFGKSHIGADFHISFNYGLSDINGVLFELGPSYRYDLTDRIFLNVPVNCMYATLSQGKQDMDMWMMKVAPTIYAGVGKLCLFIGPQWCYNITGSDSNFGLRVGLAF